MNRNTHDKDSSEFLEMLESAKEHIDTAMEAFCEVTNAVAKSWSHLVRTSLMPSNPLSTVNEKVLKEILRTIETIRRY